MSCLLLVFFLYVFCLKTRINFFFQIGFCFIKLTFWGSVGVKEDISQSFVCNYPCGWGLGSWLAQVQVWLHEWVTCACRIVLGMVRDAVIAEIYINFEQGTPCFHFALGLMNNLTIPALWYPCMNFKEESLPPGGYSHSVMPTAGVFVQWHPTQPYVAFLVVVLCFHLSGIVNDFWLIKICFSCLFW